jgi:mono/diheme cytochrome c family protein
MNHVSLIARAAGLAVLLASSLAIAQPQVAADAPAAPVDPSLADGRRLFQAHCSHCHSATPGRPGTAALERRAGKERSVLEDRTDLQPAYVDAVVRFGMNAMIPFRRTEISDSELQAIARWLARPRAAQASGAALPQWGRQ